MVKVGELTANVARLIDDVKADGEKLDGIKHQVSFIKGAVWASAAFLAVLITVVSFFLSAKWEAVAVALEALQK
jgi:hypothetical protein